MATPNLIGTGAFNLLMNWEGEKLQWALGTSAIHTESIASILKVNRYRQTGTWKQSLSHSCEDALLNASKRYKGTVPFELTLPKDNNFTRKGKLEVKIHIPVGDKDCLNFHGLIVVWETYLYSLLRKTLCHSTAPLLFKSWSSLLASVVS